MAKTSDEFGSWRTAPDGTAHYLLAGRCLCGANAEDLGPPARRRLPSGQPGLIAAPLCPECLALNIARWSRGGSGQFLSSVEARMWRWLREQSSNN
jgi:hypothetical protein